MKDMKSSNFIVVVLNPEENEITTKVFHKKDNAKSYMTKRIYDEAISYGGEEFAQGILEANGDVVDIYNNVGDEILEGDSTYGFLMEDYGKIVTPGYINEFYVELKEVNFED